MSRTFRPPISVFLAHPSEAVRLKLGDEIAGTGITVIGESGNGREALARILDLAPDVALLACDMNELTGVDVCRALRAELPVCRVLLLADEQDDDADGFVAGALGCYLIDAPQISLVQAIRGTMRRESLPTPGWAKLILEQYAELTSTEADRMVPPPKLTPTETDVLTRVAAGESITAIAEADELTTHIVRFHASSAIIKLCRTLGDEQMMEPLD